MTDSFSFSRLESVWNFYHSRMMRQWMWILLALVLIYALGLLGTAIGSFGTVSLALTLLSYPVYFSPLVFAMRDRSLPLQLPATAGEKMAVMLLYCLVIIPLSVMAMWYSLEGIGGMLTGGLNVMAFQDAEIDRIVAEAGNGFPTYLRDAPLMRLSCEMVPTLVCLYTVLASRTRRVLKSVVSVFATLFALGFAGGIYGLVMAFRYPPLKNGANIEKNVEDFTGQLLQDVPLFSIAISAVLSLAFIFLIWRKLRRGQI